MRKWSLVLSLCLLISLCTAGVAFAEPPGEVISNTLNDSITVQSESEPIPHLLMTWTIPSEVTVNQPFQVEVTTENDGDLENIDNVLYIIEVEDDQGNAVDNSVITAESIGGDSPGYELGYKDGYFYFGPETGFTFTGRDPVTTTFETTINQTGIYDITVYAVQLQ